MNVVARNAAIKNVVTVEEKRGQYHGYSGSDSHSQESLHHLCV